MKASKRIARAVTESLETRQLLTTITVAPVVTTEPDAASQAVFTATLDTPSATPITLHYATGGGTATANKDYVRVNSSLVIPAGATSAVFTVTILPDNISEPIETFDVHLGVGGRGNSVNRIARATIIDNDAPPTVSVSDVSVVEGSARHPGTAVVDVSLTNPSSQVIKLRFSTIAGTALAGSDYKAAEGVLSIRPGKTTATIKIRIKGDSVPEPDEYFNVEIDNLAGTANATVPVNTYGRVVILDDDGLATAARPQLSVSSPVVAAGGAAVFTVSLSAPTTQDVSFRYRTVSPGTSTAANFVAESAVYTIPAGQTTGTISVTTSLDPNLAGDRTFDLAVTAAANANAPDRAGTATVVYSPAVVSVAGTVIAASKTDTTFLPFTVSLSAPSAQTITVHYNTLNGTAFAGVDYTAVTGDLTFSPGVTSQVVNVPVFATSFATGTKTIALQISAVTSGTLGTDTAAGTIYPAGTAVLPSISATSASITEGNSGTKQLAFTVSLAPAAGATVTVDYATADGTATAGSDYSATSGTLTFSPGQTTKTIYVSINGDTAVEPDEYFTINFTNAAGASLATNSVIGTILNDDVATPVVPVISAAGSSVVEGNVPTTTPLPFTITLSQATTNVVTVAYQTSDGTATAGLDYVAASGTVTFPAGTTSRVVDVTVIGDNIIEPNETINLTLSNPTNGTLSGSAATAVGTIIDDDSQGGGTSSTTTVSVVGGNVAEGNSGTAQLPFTITLSNTSTSAVTVNYATSDDTATAGSDYTAKSGTVTFNPGQTSTVVNVSVIGDTAVEDDETVYMTLSGQTNSTLLAPLAIGTIVNDDQTPAGQTPVMSVMGSAEPEGNTGPTAMPFIVTLSTPSTTAVTAHYQTSDGTATAGSDYQASAGTVTFPAGQTAAVVTVSVLGDANVEPDETFRLTLSNPAGATLGTTYGVGRIVNDDAVGPPARTLNISNASLLEGNSGITLMSFNVSLSATTTATVTANYNTSNLAATAQSDYLFNTGTVVFYPGQSTRTVDIAIVGDTVVEPDERFNLILSDPANATIPPANATGVGTILNDDGGASNTPSMSIAAASVAEGNSGITPLVFTVSLSNASSTAVTAHYQTSDGTANAGTDYQAASGTVTFTPGQTSTTVTVSVFGDTVVEPDETLFVTLSNPVGATLATANATGTILNDDGTGSQPTVSIVPAASVNEGNSGTTLLPFVVTLSNASTGTVTVNYATADGTATAPSDYAAATGTLTFTAGVTTQTISVIVNGDTTVEPNETLTVTLSNPANATLGNAVSTGTIVNDDGTTGNPTTLSDNTFDNTGGVDTATGPTWIASSFLTTNATATLNSVTLVMDQTAPGTPVVELYADNNDQPGTLVGTLTNPSTIPSTLSAVTFSTPGIALAANTKYWVVLRAPTGSFNWSFAGVNTGNGPGFTDESAQSTDSGNTWFITSPPADQMQVIVT